jgi:putative glycosyltransferase (TIGR04348 family)
MVVNNRPRLVIVTPALADANNGNWQTARRWAGLLAQDYKLALSARWQGGDEEVMIALHARRSAPSIAAWRAQRGAAPLVLAMTGTDLYRDIDHDADAQRSMYSADALVVLNTLGADRLPAALRERCHVVLQSCPARRLLPKTRRHLRVLMVGHLRDEKDPLTYLRAAQRLGDRTDILLDHIGAALDPKLGDAATACMAAQPRYRWLGALPHGTTRKRIQAAHLLVHASRMEGGAHVVIEALRSGTPVLASHIDGNLGLLGRDWPAVFEPGDDAALATLLARARDEPDMLAAWALAAERRAPLFDPETERESLLHALRTLPTPRRLDP